MKLHEIPKGSRIKAETQDGEGNKLGDYIIFHHIDGMYSYCTVEGTSKAVHLKAWTELEKDGEVYIFDHVINLITN